MPLRGSELFFSFYGFYLIKYTTPTDSVINFLFKIHRFYPDYNCLPLVQLMGMENTGTEHPIDIVVAWVNGEDPILKKKRMRYLNQNEDSVPPGAAQTRFHSLNEIEYCVLSIFKFAPFVRKVFIVTDQQNPELDEVVKRYFPNRLPDVSIVDHTEIFRGYEEFLPTFNSICISNMLWRIKGLADHFVYFNDDIFLLRPVQPTDWFIDQKPVLRGKWRFPPYERLLWDSLKEGVKRIFAPESKNERVASFQVNQWNAAQQLGFTFRYFRSGHTPLAMRKTTLEKYFTAHPERLKKNISFRFRNYVQFNTVALANHLEIKTGNKNHNSSQALYLQPHNRGKEYVALKFNRALKEENLLFICVQSLDLATHEDQEAVLQRMKSILELQ